MSNTRCAIFVAVNDNRRAWYEMLIPFVLSLRATDFDGRLVVLGYGLSGEKTAILEGQGIDVVAASPTESLPLGRYVEVARYCAAHPEIEKAALYDADIWFCSPHHDLFALVAGDTLHACPDPLFCQFVLSPLAGPRKEELTRQVADGVVGRYGAALQAGLVAGTAGVWAAFARHVETCRGAIGTDFRDCFGIDTTVLHLWAAANAIVLLPMTQNLITRAGITEVWENGGTRYTAGTTGDPVRALHMSGDVRFYDRWRFYGNRASLALADGPAFALSSGALADGGGGDRLRDACAARGLRATAVRTEATGGSGVDVLDTATGLSFFCEGNVELTLEAIDDIPALNIYMSHPSGFPSPIRRSVTCLGHASPSQNDLLTHYRYTLGRGARITLSSTSLGGQLCKSIWFLSDRPDIQQ